MHNMEEQLLQSLQKILSGNSSGSIQAITSRNDKLLKDSMSLALSEIPSKKPSTKIDNKTVGGLIGTGTDILTSVGKNLVDAPELTNSTGVNLANKGGDALLATGNPYAMIAGGLLKGGALLEQLTAKTNKGTDKDLVSSISGYNADIVEDKTTGAVSKGLDWLFGKKKKKETARTNRLNTANRSNLLKSQVSGEDARNQLLATNNLNSIVGSNLDQLYQINNSRVLAVKKGGSINPATLRNIVKRAIRSLEGVTIEEEVFEPEVIKKFEQGGQIKNVIPSGALHAHKNNYEGDLKNTVTSKGIPVISHEEGGKMEQHAEIERDEIVFNKETTESILELYEKWKDSDDYDKYDIEIKAGKLLTFEILQNTEDNTGLINQIE